MDVKIGDYFMKDFGLKLLSVELKSPEVQKRKQEIPGKNGALDLSEAITGYPVYSDTKHTLKFDFEDGDYDTWIARASKLKGKLHGRRLPVVLGRDKYYYDARISVETEKLNPLYSGISVELDAEPYKLSLLSSLDDWPWDDFNFEEDVIREYKDIAAPAELVIVGDVMPAGCVFHCAAGGISVEYEGVVCALPEGSSTAPDILVTEGEHVMKFTGSGNVSVEYRGGRF